MSQTAVDRAEQLFEQAKEVMASGVSASMRLHPYLGRPLYVSHGQGPYLFGLDGKRYIDFNVSNGAAILGHHHPAVQQAVQRGVEAGIITAAETPFHEKLASILTEIIPSAERVRFASVGSEVTLVAVRLARHATGRSKILKFDGHFHGLTEPFLLKRDNPTEDDGQVVPSSGGIPASYATDVVMAPWNDADAFEQAVTRHADDLAAVILEPIHYNAGCIPPEPGFLELIRRRATETGAVLIFDEVLSGFRTALGGVQEQIGIIPDLSTFAKALANGMPLSALVGRADLMEHLAPSGPVAHSGTYSGHLLSVLAALATLDELRQPGTFDRINATGAGFYRDLQTVFDRHELPVRVQGRGARFGLYFGIRDQVRTYANALDHDHELNKQFALGCVERGVYFHAYTRQGPPGHAGFSLAHTPEDLAETLNIVDAVAADLAGRRGR